MSARLHRIESSPDLVEQAYRALLDAIHTGALRPGQRITQEELAEELSVSRQPVMQALRLLKRDGFVLDAPQLGGHGARTRGLQVAPVDARQIVQVYEVRCALEQLAVRLAARQRVRLDPALFQQAREAEQRRDLKALIDADSAFHGAIYRAAGNPFIEQSAQLHWQHIRRAMGLALQHVPVRKPVWDEHRAIADAIAAGDGERAALLVADHTGKAAHALGEQLGRAVDDDRGNAPLTPQLRGRRRPAQA